MATKKTTKKTTKKQKTYGFSLNRALGITQMKAEFARKTGIPTTKAGMQRKFDRIVTKSLFAKRGILFWAGVILFFPITVPICLVKNHKLKKQQYFEAIESYYLEQFPQDVLENSDKKTVLFQAEQFKQYFDAQKMPKACKQYYVDKYNTIINFIGPVEEDNSYQPQSNDAISINDTVNTTDCQ